MPAFTHLEFHRTGIGLVPDRPGERHTAIYVARVPGSDKALRSCTCEASKKKTCDHLKVLSQAVAEIEKALWVSRWEAACERTCDHLKVLSQAVAEIEKALWVSRWEAAFESSVWYRLARLQFEGDPQASAKVRVLRVPRAPQDAGTLIRVTSPRGDELADYLDTSPARVRFLERTGKAALDGDGIFDRAGLLERLALFQATEQEARPRSTATAFSTGLACSNGSPCSRPRSRSASSTRPA